MSNTSMPMARASGNEFRIGRVFDRTTSVYTRNFLLFTLVPLIANLPSLLIPSQAGSFAATGGGPSVTLILVAVILTVMLGLLSQAILVYASFQDMRGKPVDIGESLNVALARLFPILGVIIIAGVCTMIGFMLFIIPGIILFTMWFVGIPVCVVERRGPWESLMRSGELTKGHRWKLFGIILLFYIVSIVVAVILGAILGLFGGVLVRFADVIWNGIWGGFFAVFVVVTYYELRSAKEGVDIEQIASVFD